MATFFKFKVKQRNYDVDTYICNTSRHMNVLATYVSSSAITCRYNLQHSFNFGF